MSTVAVCRYIFSAEDSKDGGLLFLRIFARLGDGLSFAKSSGTAAGYAVYFLYRAASGFLAKFFDNEVIGVGRFCAKTTCRFSELNVST